MSLKIKTFQIARGTSLDYINSQIYDLIGYDAYLITDMHSFSIGLANVVSISYLDSAPFLYDYIAPYPGATLGTGIAYASDPYTLEYKVIFPHKIDSNSLQSGFVTIDNVNTTHYNLPNDYTLRISLEDGITSGYHDLRIDSTKFQYQNGTSAPYDGLFGYLIQENTVAGSVSTPVYNKRGEVRVGVVAVQKAAEIQKAIEEYLDNLSLSFDRLLKYSVVYTNSIQVYFLYIHRLEPQIVQGFPLNNVVYPTEFSPKTLLLTYNTEIDKNCLNTSGLYTIYKEYNTTTPITYTPVVVQLLSDNKTIRLVIDDYIDAGASYSILSNTGLRSVEGFSKEKPEMWSFVIGNNVSVTGTISAGSGVSETLFTGHTGDSTIHYAVGGIGLSGEQITGGIISPSTLGSGSPSSSNYLRGDSSWQTITKIPVNYTLFAEDVTSANIINASLRFYPKNNEDRIFLVFGDLYTQCRITINIAAVADSGAVCTLKYYTSFSTTVGDYLNIGDVEECIVPLDTIGIVDSGWVTMTSGARIDPIYCSLFSISGSNSASCNVGLVNVFFR